mmetsp:Transcript_3067/g.4135  ORF Transcript_3067/g.4135 Transcript_3067/m.4135 type:complete len:217 (+) Transcript_3067:85-735(+)
MGFNAKALPQLRALPASKRLFLWIIVFMATSILANPNKSGQKVDVIWQEEQPIPEVEPETTKEPKRKFFYISKRLTPQSEKATKGRSARPHQLRTDTWELKLKWKRTLSRNQNISMQLEFAKNGFVREITNSTALTMGKWSSSMKGVSWNLVSETENLLFHGDVMLNSFGSQPKLIRGVILDNSCAHAWFRPVVGTFSGEGIGEDTADFSYSNRKR